MRVLVLGGTHFFGAEIVKLLLHAGHEVSVFTRGNSQPAWFDKVHHIQGDRFDPAGFRATLRGQKFDVVVDNIAYNAQDIQSAIDTFEGNIGRYILTSSCGVYRFVRERRMPLKEDDVDFEWEPPGYDPDDARSQYYAGKMTAERALGERPSIPYTIIRPPIVFGPYDHTLRGFFYVQRLLDGRPLILTNSGTNSFRLAYSRDLAHAYLLAIDNDAAIGVTYAVAQTDIMTLKDLIDASAEALGVKPNLVSIPQDVIAQSDLEYADPYGRMINFIPSVQRVQAELGYVSTPFREWIGETAIWFRDEYQGPDTEGYGRRDQEVAFAEWYRDRVWLG